MQRGAAEDEQDISLVPHGVQYRLELCPRPLRDCARLRIENAGLMFLNGFDPRGHVHTGALLCRCDRRKGHKCEGIAEDKRRAGPPHAAIMHGRPTDLRTHGPTDPRTYGPSDLRT
jgi:hypothetical protein